MTDQPRERASARSDRPPARPAAAPDSDPLADDDVGVGIGIGVGDDGDEGLQGRDLRSLGPSDSSDSGSDLLGPGQIDDDLLRLDRGTTEDSEGGHLTGSDPGASLGDLRGAHSSDRYGTGEHMTAGREPEVRVAADIAPDRIVGAQEAGLSGLESKEAALKRGATWPWALAATVLLVGLFSRWRLL